jgi:hyaluronan synthase
MLEHFYDIPDVTLRPGRRLRVACGILVVLVLWGGYRVISLDREFHNHAGEALLWSALFLVAAQQFVIAWFDKPFVVTPSQQDKLDRLVVTVNVPVWNEDPAILDRVLYSLFSQTRLPDYVQVVDDGSTAADYSEVRSYWQQQHPSAVRFSWMQFTANQGKRHAQAATFRRFPGDIFVTLDSDTTLDRKAIAEGLKPFAIRRVMSVAGVEVAMNAHANLLTRISSLRQLSWQYTQCSALSVAGSVLVNRGTFALYRAEVLRDNLDSYVSETFLGNPVSFSDDSLLTLFALKRGRAVQQATSFQLPMYPDNVGHALRQWIRWMRGSTIRNFWRLRYLPLGSYGWWMSVFSWWQFWVSCGAYIFVFGVRPVEGHFSIVPIVVILLCSYLVALRNLLISRSDHPAESQLNTYLLAPLCLLWSMLVLRPFRIYGMLTCGKAGWVTRAKVEIAIDSSDVESDSALLRGETWHASATETR